ncbi:MAG: hypothetical protein OSA99_12480 [Acidimicrobiales bacterium]|nr:hypothetical protein [Acidimicrobiales bacterium]
MSTRTVRLPLVALLAATLTLAACGGDDDTGSESPDATTMTADDIADTTTTIEEVDDETGDEVDGPDDQGAADVPGAEADPTATMLGDKAILLDGLLGVRIPAGWAVSTATVPEPSVSPAGGETEVDTDAIDQVLVMGPEEDPRAATFALLHYSHSDSVPGLTEFTDGIRGVLGADGTKFTEGQSARIGGQDAVLHQLQTPDGDSGVYISLLAGDEYFFIVSIVSDGAYADDAGDLVASISFEPAAIG